MATVAVYLGAVVAYLAVCLLIARCCGIGTRKEQAQHEWAKRTLAECEQRGRGEAA